MTNKSLPDFVLPAERIAAFDNDGDLQMLQWATAGSGLRFALCVRYTEAKRAWAYDRNSSIGCLDKGRDEARAKDWTLMDMQPAWNTIYPPAKN